MDYIANDSSQQESNNLAIGCCRVKFSLESSGRHVPILTFDRSAFAKENARPSTSNTLWQAHAEDIVCTAPIRE
jgi:hypothetical protein